MLIHLTDDPELAEAARHAILRDERLSLAACAMLMKILDHAPEWDINAKKFQEICEDARGLQAESKRGIRMAFRQLEEMGYMRRTKGRKSSGDFYTWLEVFDVPHQFATSTEGRDHGTMPKDGDGMVYIVGPVDGSVVKIGTTVNVDVRLRSMQTSHPLLLIARWSCPGNVQLESYLHRRFDEIRMRGEWFDFGDVDPIAEVSAAAELFYELRPGALARWNSPDTAAG